MAAISPHEAAAAADEELRARELASRYHCEFLDLQDFRLDAALLRKVEVGLMFRYNFVPLEEERRGSGDCHCPIPAN